MACRLNDLKASGENSCVTVNSRGAEGSTFLGERSLNDDLTRRLTLHDVNKNICFAANRSLSLRSNEPIAAKKNFRMDGKTREAKGFSIHLFRTFAPCCWQGKGFIINAQKQYGSDRSGFHGALLIQHLVLSKGKKTQRLLSLERPHLPRCFW